MNLPARALPPQVADAIGAAVQAGLREAELRQYLPEGLDYPQEIPADIFECAMTTYVSMQRIEMQTLAQDAGVSRRTLYRKLRDRNHLLSEIHWFNARIIFAEGLAQSRQLSGAARVVAIYAHFLESVRRAEPLMRQLREEPENTLTLLTTKQGVVHGRVVQFIRRCLERELESGAFSTSLPPDALALAIVRIGESFLYSEVLTGESADYRFSVEMISRLLRPDQIRSAHPVEA